MISIARRGIQSFVQIVLLLGTFVLLASCSGAVSAPPSSSGPLSISPAAATVYTDLPTTFVVTGGNGSYLITSSDQSAIPFAGAFEGSAFTIVPGPVAVDTPVTLTVRDTATATPVTAALTVKPRTVSNVVTVIPSASQSAACGSAICAGGDAEVRVVLAQAGVPLAHREVRFEVVSGDFRIITSAPGTSEVLSLSGTTITDSNGTARIRIRALSTADAQTGLIQITDVSSGSFTRTGISIAPSSNAPSSAQPEEISFLASISGECPSGLTAEVIVFGGRPPYQISQPGTFFVSPRTVFQSGDRFTVQAIGQCTEGSEIAVVDANGASTSVTVKALQQVIIVPSEPPLVVAPDTVTIDSCSARASAIVAGGNGGPYFHASSNLAVGALVNGNVITIDRDRTSAAPGAGPFVVSISDGRSVVEIIVNLTGVAATTGC